MAFMLCMGLFETIECLIEIASMHTQPGMLNMAYVRSRRLCLQEIGGASHELGILEVFNSALEGRGQCGLA